MSFFKYRFGRASSHGHYIEAEGAQRSHNSLGGAAEASEVPSNIQGRSKYGGITIRYQPPPDRKTLADIVFVHGLRGDQKETWLHKESGVFWPLHLLSKEEYIQDARIVTFGYGSEVVEAWLGGHPSSNQLAEHGRNLLTDLTHMRDETDSEGRMIIFVGHSLGGLVIDQALINSRNNASQHRKEVEKFTIGILYLGTPHAGSDLAEWATACTQVLRMFKDVNRDILKVLREDSEILKESQENLGQLLENRRNEGNAINIVCFYEEKEVTGTGKIVTERSAKLFAYNAVGIPENHMDMTKFRTADDVGYGRIQGELRRLIKHISPQTDRSAVRECLRSIHYRGLDDRRKTIKPECLGTCNWIWDLHDLGFRRWFRQGNGIYWISGKPGCGKSVLMNFLYNTISLANPSLDLESKQPLQSSDEWPIVTISHFFDFRGSPLLNSLEGFSRALLWQILKEKPEFCLRLVSVFKEKRDSESQLCWNLHDLKKELLFILDKVNFCHLVIFVDALDEYAGEDAEIAEFVDELAKTLPVTCHLCVASRPYPDFKFKFSTNSGLCLDKKNSADIEAFTQLTLDPLLLDPHYSFLVGSIITKARGNFRWVDLATQELLRGFKAEWPPEYLENTLKKMPQKLEDMYRRILNQLSPEDKSDAIQMLLLVACATESPHIRAFRRAFQLSKDSPVTLKEEFGGRVDKVCRGLLDIRNELVTFSHETVSTFVSSKAFEDESSSKLQEGHLLFLKASLRYIEELSPKISRGKKFEARALDLKRSGKGKSTDSVMFFLLDVDPVEISFAWTSFNNWPSFWKKCEGTEHPPYEMLHRFLHGPGFETWRTVQHTISWIRSREVEFLPSSPMETAIRLGLEQYVEWFLTQQKNGLRIENGVSGGESPFPTLSAALFSATSHPDTTLLELILNNKACFPDGKENHSHEAVPYSPIGRAILCSSLTKAEILLDNRVDPNVPGISRQLWRLGGRIDTEISLPLHIAVKHGNNRAFRLLLRYNADPLSISTAGITNEKGEPSSHFWNSLDVAAYYCRISILYTLLPTIRGKMKSTMDAYSALLTKALFVACTSEVRQIAKYETIQLLLDRGADIKSEPSPQSLLLEAVKKGDWPETADEDMRSEEEKLVQEDILKTLLTHGARITREVWEYTNHRAKLKIILSGSPPSRQPSTRSFPEGQPRISSIPEEQKSVSSMSCEATEKKRFTSRLKGFSSRLQEKLRRIRNNEA